MLIQQSHAWNLSTQEAYALQHTWREQVITCDQLNTIKTVAGVDVAYAKDSEQVVAAVAVLDATTLAPIEIAYANQTAQFPYVPGLFSFRELPAIIAAFEQLQTVPDLVVCDGQGLAHPRRFGLACHLGVMLDLPTLGCAKSRFIGEYDEPDLSRGSISALRDQGEQIGSVLRTQTGIKPVFVSIGHKISQQTACEWVLRLTPQYRLPETTRAADHAVRERLSALEQTPNS